MQTATAQQIQKNYRIQSIDLLRGLVMIVMALDHVRDFFHSQVTLYDPLDFSKTSTAIFLTRWITHFCAPVFVFLAGTSAYLVGVRKGKRALSKFLLTRGIWLIIVEIIIMNFAFSFDWRFSVIGLQTIWALGISMIVLSLLIYLPKQIILVLALLIIAFHNTLDTIQVEGTDLEALGWSLLHEPKFFPFKPFSIFVLYPVLPWIGVMAAGYCFGELYSKYDADKRKKLLIILGSVCIILFIVIRFTNLYGDESQWAKQKTPIFTFLSFINASKYPPSLLYILMTIGPAMLFLAFTERPLRRFGNIIATYGKVPMFYYILHFYLIHIAAKVAGLLSGYSLDQVLNSGPFGQHLPGYGFRLWVVYLVWLIIVALLYPLCKRYARYKSAHPEKWWLSYL
ncbi:MAG: DUF1624 domain-containing protein [Chitinophagaceae bacterium]|nr:DUF1624 domain-containing protein [Chitinophagaceae bacterium]